MTIAVDAETFGQAIRAVAPHTSTDQDRPVLTGVFISALLNPDTLGVDEVTVTGTDSYTLARATVAIPRAAALRRFEAIVPAPPLLAWATTALGSEEVWCGAGDCVIADDGGGGCVDECAMSTERRRRRHGEVTVGLVDEDDGTVFVLADPDTGVTLAIRTLGGPYPDAGAILDDQRPADLSSDVKAHVNPAYLQRCWQSARAWSGDVGYPLRLLGLPDSLRPLRFDVERKGVGTLTVALMPVRMP